MDEQKYLELAEILEKPGRVLLLGQYYLGSSPEDNPLFAEFSAAYPNESLYNWWLTSKDNVVQRAKSLCRLEEKVLIGEGIRRMLALHGLRSSLAGC